MPISDDGMLFNVGTPDNVSTPGNVGMPDNVSMPSSAVIKSTVSMLYSNTIHARHS